MLVHSGRELQGLLSAQTLGKPAKCGLSHILLRITRMLLSFLCRVACDSLNGQSSLITVMEIAFLFDSVNATGYLF